MRVLRLVPRHAGMWLPLPGQVTDCSQFILSLQLPASQRILAALSNECRRLWEGRIFERGVAIGVNLIVVEVHLIHNGGFTAPLSMGAH